MIDPDNIKTDVKISIDFPRVITANDYHEFQEIQFVLLNLTAESGQSVFVEEVGFNSFDGQYVGFIHTGTPEHKKMAEELREYYENLEEELEEDEGYGM